MDFAFRTVTHERVARFITYLGGVMGWVRGGSLSILVAIRYSIWPPGRHLEFCIPDYNSRRGSPIYLIFGWCNGVGKGRFPIDFGGNPIFNMAARKTSWILYSGPQLKNGLTDLSHI